tara:strand:+ start:24189 stop:25304 length:1116 start_codon:yes stop_codon:yes gene_type:complete
VLLFFSCSSEDKAKKKPIPDIKVVAVEVADVPIYRDFVGQVYGYVDIPIRARVNGFLEGIHFDEGNRVTKDQLLYSIDPQPYMAEVAAQKSRLAEAKTELVRAENELVRYEDLIKTKAVSQSDYDATKAQAEASRAAVDAAQANVTMAEINLGYCKIMSPIDGLIGQTQAKVGEFVGKEPNPVILNTVSKISNVRVNFFLTESEYLQIARETEKRKNERDTSEEDHVELSLILSDGSMHRHKGKVDFVNREVDAMTGSMLVQASFPNPDKILRPGQYAKVQIKMKNVEGGLLIPQKCAQELQGKYSVYVVNDSNMVESRQIKIDDHRGDLILVGEGLTAGDKVVLDAIQQVKSGMKINPVEGSFESRTKKQ